MNATLKILDELGVCVVEPEYDQGTVWRIPRRLTAGELRHHLQKLPAVFGQLKLYLCAEALERGRESDCFRFELLEYKS